MGSNEEPLVVKADPKKKVIRGKKVISNRIPQELLDDPTLKNDMLVLPQNYNFEVPKTIWRIKTLGVKKVALQLPEGLTMFATTLADIIEKHTGAESVIMADVTYGACCVDDYSARALGCELMVHYGHSCLIPIDQTSGIKMLYVFVDIKIDPTHFVETIRVNFVDGKHLFSDAMSDLYFISCFRAYSASTYWPCQYHTVRSNLTNGSI